MHTNAAHAVPPTAAFLATSVLSIPKSIVWPLDCFFTDTEGVEADWLHKVATMKKKRSWSGLIGILMLIAGAKLFLSPDSEYLPLWVAWLVGPILWYGGFIAVSYWFLRRIFASKPEPSEGKESSTLQRRKVSIPSAGRRADSLTHCYEIVRPGVSYSKLALLGSTLGFAIAIASLRSA